MDIQAIDWNEVWKNRQTRVYDDEQNQAYWDGRARSFALTTDGGDYVARFLEVVKPEPEYRVLDVGCAAGTLAVQLASRVHQVTALDISPMMLDRLQATCKQRGIQNIQPVQASWTDDWDRLAIEPHDVVIASRSLIVPDLRQAIEKLNRYAIRRVCISTPVGVGPLDPVMFQAIGRPCNFGADYIYVYNLLYQLGINANLHFIAYQENRTYQDKDAVVTAMRHRIGELLPQEERALQEYVDRTFVCREGTWQRVEPHIIRWAVMWWSPQYKG